MGGHRKGEEGTAQKRIATNEIKLPRTTSKSLHEKGKTKEGDGKTGHGTQKNAPEKPAYNKRTRIEIKRKKVPQKFIKTAKAALQRQKRKTQKPILAKLQPWGHASREASRGAPREKGPKNGVPNQQRHKEN